MNMRIVVIMMIYLCDKLRKGFRPASPKCLILGIETTGEKTTIRREISSQ